MERTWIYTLQVGLLVRAWQRSAQKSGGFGVISPWSSCSYIDRRNYGRDGHWDHASTKPMQQQSATMVQQNRPWQAGMMAPTRPLQMTELDNNNNPLAGG